VIVTAEASHRKLAAIMLTDMVVLKGSH